MTTAIDYAVATAIGQGWTLALKDERWAVLHGTPVVTPGRKPGTGFHVVNLLGTLLTLGVWFLPYLVIWFLYSRYNTTATTSTQQLVIALDQDDNVTYEVRVNGVTQDVRS